MALSRPHRELPEIGVMSQYDAGESLRPGQYLGVRMTREVEIPYGDDVLALLPQRLNDSRVDVLVGEERKLKRLHAGTFTSQSTSCFIARAAYPTAARTASTDS